MNRPLPSYFSLTFPLEKCMKCYLEALELGKIYGQWNHTAGPIAIAIANRSSVFVWMRETGYTTPNLSEVFGLTVSVFVWLWPYTLPSYIRQIVSGRSHVLCNVILVQWGHFHGHLCLLFLCLCRNFAFLSFLYVKGRQINSPVHSTKAFVRENMPKSGCFLVFRIGAITKWRKTKIDNNTMKHLKAFMLVEPQFKYPESQQKRDCGTG